ncbi:MAG: DUF488 domain-containing protein [Alphaproteobacteria bacterium]|nr:DUF488 domain-containing protein [Alphaproteobacteria bacterium]
MTRTPSIATIGYQAADLDDLIATLKSAGIAVVADVRAAPVSKRPEYAKNALAASLVAAGIDYAHFGVLGSPPAARAAAAAGDIAGFERLFAAHLASPPGQVGLDRAAALAREKPVCLMCLERDPDHCHRRFVAAAIVARTALSVNHLAVTAPSGPLFGD